MTLLQKTIELLEKKEIDLSSLNGTLLEEIAGQIEQTRRIFHCCPGDFESKTIYDKICPYLNRLIGIRHDTRVDDAKKKMGRIRKENPADERFAILDDMWDEDDPFNPRFEEVLLKLAQPPPRKPVGCCPPQVYHDECLQYLWDLNPCYQFNPSPFARLSSQEDLDMYRQYLIIDSFLIEVTYTDYGGGYMHGDDLAVTVLFDPPINLEALLLTRLERRPRRDWSIHPTPSRSVQALLL